MKESFFIRTAAIPDLPFILLLFKETISHVNAADYEQEQLQVWASTAENKDQWLLKLDRDYFIVAESEKVIAGFASLNQDGLVDLLYVHKDFQRRGIALDLLKRLEEKAKQLDLIEIFTDASITAYPFFLKHGFTVTEEYIKQKNGVPFLNRKMRKELKPA